MKHHWPKWWRVLNHRHSTVYFQHILRKATENCNQKYISSGLKGNSLSLVYLANHIRALSTHLFHFLCLIDVDYKNNGASGTIGYFYAIKIIFIIFFFCLLKLLKQTHSGIDREIPVSTSAVNELNTIPFYDIVHFWQLTSLLLYIRALKHLFPKWRFLRWFNLWPKEIMFWVLISINAFLFLEYSRTLTGLIYHFYFHRMDDEYANLNPLPSTILLFF